jgi:hypothetical protein
MTVTQLGSFLRDCIITHETPEEGLTPDELYGLYVSWCFLANVPPANDRNFRSALAAHGIRPVRRGHHSIYPGLSMTGPAATDYILNSAPGATDSAKRLDRNLLPE